MHPLYSNSHHERRHNHVAFLHFKASLWDTRGKGILERFTCSFLWFGRREFVAVTLFWSLVLVSNMYGALHFFGVSLVGFIPTKFGFGQDPSTFEGSANVSFSCWLRSGDVIREEVKKSLSVTPSSEAAAVVVLSDDEAYRVCAMFVTRTSDETLFVSESFGCDLQFTKLQQNPFTSNCNLSSFLNPEVTSVWKEFVTHL